MSSNEESYYIDPNQQPAEGQNESQNEPATAAADPEHDLNAGLPEGYESDHSQSRPESESQTLPDNPQADAAEHATSFQQADSQNQYITDAYSSKPDSPEDLSQAGGKLDAAPSHSFDATPKQDLSQDATLAEPDETPAPAGVAIGETHPAATLDKPEPVSGAASAVHPPAPEGATTPGSPSPVLSASDIQVDGAPDQQATNEEHASKVNDALELNDAIGEELLSLRAAVRVLRSNSAAAQPGTFVFTAIQDIEAAIARIELSAEKSSVDVSQGAVEKRRAERTKQAADKQKADQEAQQKSDSDSDSKPEESN